jgi:4-aminobutyrate aminotransferase
MKNLLVRFKKVASPVLGRYFSDFAVDHGKGCYLFSTDGKKYLDFSSGIASCSTGHAHPKVVAAAIKQAKKLMHICIGVALYEPYIKLAEKLQKVVPMKNAQFFFCQSGSEAIEAALKLAKYATKKPGIIAIKGAFHGRTLGALSVTTSKMKYRDGYEPLLPAVQVLSPDLQEIEAKLKEHPVAGIIVELILGEGGYIMQSKEFIAGLRKLCDQYQTLLIFDEVQTGIGRTGKWFAAEHFGVQPDIICMAKGIASGFPLGGIAASSEIMAKWSPGAHGSTFGGNPVCCAAAIATLDVIKKEKLLQNATKLGAYMKNKLTALQSKHPQLIKDVRGIGLMIGVDFGDSTIVKNILNACLAKGLVLISTGGDGTVIRFVPPLIVKKAEIDQALKIFGQAVTTSLCR